MQVGYIIETKFGVPLVEMIIDNFGSWKKKGLNQKSLPNMFFSIYENLQTTEVVSVQIDHPLSYFDFLICLVPKTCDYL